MTDIHMLKDSTIAQRLKVSIGHRVADWTSPTPITTTTRFIDKLMEQKQREKRQYRKTRTEDGPHPQPLSQPSSMTM